MTSCKTCATPLGPKNQSGFCRRHWKHPNHETHFQCGHERSTANTIGHGQNRCCRTCREAYNAARLAFIADKRAEIVRQYESGVLPDDLATRFDYSLSHIHTILRAAGHYQRDAKRVPTPAVLKAAAEVGGANVPQLISEWRAPKQLVHARWAAMAVLSQRGASSAAIGRALNRDHSTVLYGIKQANYLAARSPEFVAMLDEVARAA